MAELSPGDFDAYFKAVHGKTPFPWQKRLLLHVVARGGNWPELLDLPTGTGKTAAIDVALFHLALEAPPSRPPAERRASLRIVMVVDRRTVVDQAFERAKKIREELAGARKGILRWVADALRRVAALDENDAPLAIAELRGGMPRDDGWAKRPDQPLVAVSTVDQVGSRLLFRGYGVSEAMRPIHAGLLGNDTLLLLDEVHLSEPFRQTLATLRRHRAWTFRGLPDRWQFVEMSATPGKRGDVEPFGLEQEDRRDEELARRLVASKPVERYEVKVSGAEAARRAAFADACVERAAPFATPGRTVGVIVNRVATARDVAARLRQRLRDPARVRLVTGRMRPLDRDELDDELKDIVASDRERDPSAHPVVVVSTQCIEAGADFDFDALVTECASLDALRQRFGRLNRLGTIDDACGVVLVRSDALGKDAEDPIYGRALAKTWEWLHALRDFGVDAMQRALCGVRIEELLPPRGRAPVMLPAHLDAWAQTMPAPQPDPEVSLWLHGIERRQEPEVQVVWRADVTEALLAAADRDALVERIEVCPPVGLEALSLPIHAVRAWLSNEAADDVTDVDGTPREDVETTRKPRERCAVLWKRDESSVIGPKDLHPGATIVVPSTYGGIDGDGVWDPSSKTRVRDRGDEARLKQTGRPVLRLHQEVADASWEAPLPSEADDPEADDAEAVAKWIARLGRDADREDWLRRALAGLAGKGRRRPAIVRLPAWEDKGNAHVANGYLVVIGRHRVKEEGYAEDVTTEDDDASHTGVKVTLREHLGGVASWAQDFVTRCGLPPKVADDLVLAARWHDTGKVDPRFQRLLHGGSAYLASTAKEPIAKSATVAADRAARARAQARSGYPERARHELASIALMLEAGAPLRGKATDPDLVLHLVASHHGRCRPFAPVVEDLDPVAVALDTATLELDLGGITLSTSSDHGLARLDSGIAERFFRLCQRYGWHGLAWLEAILRLADHRRSEQEQHLKEEP
jgi:CRISPR-associated endonuclease/helicase Cas3